jgi:hypothetical protein
MAGAYGVGRQPQNFAPVERVICHQTSSNATSRFKSKPLEAKLF